MGTAASTAGRRPRTSTTSSPAAAAARAGRGPRRWLVERVKGTAALLHGRPFPTARSATFYDVVRPAVVLGSTQRDVGVDPDRAAAAGIDVVRRRSGGGAVWLDRGE